MKDPRIVKLRHMAERDFTISDGALRLILRICTEIYTNPHAMPEDSFPLSAGKVAMLCGRKDHEICYRRIYELLPQAGVSYGNHRRSYLKRVELRGCPPTWWFKLNL